jgi:hypothetical protein
MNEEVLTESASVRLRRFNALGLHFGPAVVVQLQVWLQPDGSSTYAVVNGRAPAGCEGQLADEARALVAKLEAIRHARTRMRETHTHLKAVREQEEAERKSSSALLPRVTRL